MMPISGHLPPWAASVGGLLFLKRAVPYWVDYWTEQVNYASLDCAKPFPGRCIIEPELRDATSAWR